MYDPKEIGPALQRLRESRGLKQAELAQRLGRSTQTISRLEQAGANPQGSSLLRYLDAVGATLSDFAAEIRSGDPLDEAVLAVEQRLRDEPELRRLAAEMLERFCGSEVAPELRALAALIDSQEKRLAEVERELRPQGEERRPNGANGG